MILGIEVRDGAVTARMAKPGVDAATAAEVVRALDTNSPSHIGVAVRDTITDGDVAAITVAHVFDAARQGAGVAISVVRDTARDVGMAIGNLVAVIDPEVIVLGGLISNAADLPIEPSRLEASRRMPAHVARSIRIEPAVLGDDAGPLGAARAAMLAR